MRSYMVIRCAKCLRRPDVISRGYNMTIVECPSCKRGTSSMDRDIAVINWNKLYGEKEQGKAKGPGHKALCIYCRSRMKCMEGFPMESGTLCAYPDSFSKEDE